MCSQTNSVLDLLGLTSLVSGCSGNDGGFVYTLGFHSFGQCPTLVSFPTMFGNRRDGHYDCEANPAAAADSRDHYRYDICHSTTKKTDDSLDAYHDKNLWAWLVPLCCHLLCSSVFCKLIGSLHARQNPAAESEMTIATTSATLLQRKMTAMMTTKTNI
jgi:hypothetical protein